MLHFFSRLSRTRIERLTMPRLVEICVTDVASARAAAEGGADRVELCAELASGGITPSVGMIGRIVRNLAIPVHVLIRPRGGDFVHDFDEIGVMLDDINAARAAGAAGVVLGVLTAESRLDAVETARLADSARPMSVTFHKAFDLVRDAAEALDLLIALGIDRVLTSGGPGAARDNVSTLRSLVRQAAGRIAIMAGGSIAERDMPGLLDATGLEEIHLGSGVTGPAPTAGPFGARPAPVESGRVRRIVRLVRPS
jgi:copper homeostasis protein